MTTTIRVEIGITNPPNLLIKSGLRIIRDDESDLVIALAALLRTVDPDYQIFEIGRMEPA